MLDAETVFKILKDLQSIESHLGPQWLEFSRRGGDLASRFAAIAANADSRAASRALESAVNKLLKICYEYEYTATLLDRADDASWEPGRESGGTMRPPAPTASSAELKVNPQELANRFYSLLARLRTVEQEKKDTHDSRTHT